MAAATKLNVFLFVPNLIGYVRVILAITSFIWIEKPAIFLPSYAVSCLLDAVDGHLARMLNQCTKYASASSSLYYYLAVGSKFGAVLDMVADRSTTAGLTAYLAHIYPQYMAVFFCLIGLDLSSHYMHMYSSLSSGSSSHKTVQKGSNVLLHMYYTSRKVLFWVCAFNELFYILLYCLHHNVFTSIRFTLIRFDSTEVNLTLILLAISCPIWAFKQIVNVIQMCGAAKTLVRLEFDAPKSR